MTTSAQLGRHVGVSTQAASEMCRRLASDGLLEPSTGRGLVLTDRRAGPPPTRSSAGTPCSSGC